MPIQTNPPPPADKNSLPVGTLGVIADVLKSLGIDSDSLLRQHGIQPSALHDPLLPSSLQVHGQIMLAAMEASHMEHLPLVVGERSQLDNVGPVKALVLNAPTAREALDNLLHYARLWYQGLQFRLEFDQGYAVLSFNTEALFDGREALLSAFQAGAVRNLRLILGQDWKPALVRLAQRRPSELAPYTALFRAPVLFDQARHEVLFPETDLDRRLERSDPQLQTFLKRQLDALKTQQPQQFSDQVLGLIQGLLLQGSCSNERLAAQLGLERHALYRRLKQEGVSYEDLLEKSRRQLAQRMLADTDMPIAEIALVLGYAAQGNFTRAFARWFGVSPSQWRFILVKRPPT